MKVRYLRGQTGPYGSRSNIMFPTPFPMRGGKFPKDHPCSANPDPTIFGTAPATPDPLGVFRGKGYADASCFPEGDGIAFLADDDKPDSRVMKDIADAFGFVVFKG